jgi:hypothetical protein
MFKLFFPTALLSLYNSLKLPLNCLIFCLWKGKNLFSGSTEFDSFYETNNGKKIKKTLGPFLNEHGIRDDLYVIDYPHPMCFAVGNNLKKTSYLSKLVTARSDCAIFLTKDFFEKDFDACSFILKHEVAHLKYWDVFFSSAAQLGLLLLLCTAAYPFVTLPVSIALSIYVFPALSQVGRIGYMYLREYFADSFAIKHSSPDELKGGIRYFLGLKNYNATFYLKQPQFDSEGEARYDYEHPSFKSRIQRLKKELKKRGVDCNLSKDSPEVKTIEDMLHNANHALTQNTILDAPVLV